MATTQAWLGRSTELRKADHGGDVDHHTAARVPQVRHRGARHQVDGAHVHVLREVPVIEADALHGAAHHHGSHARVVEENVQATEGAHGFRDHPLASIGPGEVSGDRDDLAARRPHVGRGARELRLAQVGDRCASASGAASV